MNEASPPTLLFVDDEPSILSALRRLFRPHGYTILMAESGDEGLEIIAREHVDLVISDMRMPIMDGARFLEQVRLRQPSAVRILLTGYADISSTIDAINCGEIYRYIAKPWDDNDIVLLVRDALERSRLERENARLLALTRQQNDELRDLNASLEQKVQERTAELRQTMSFLEQAHQNLKKNFVAIVKVFSSLIELRGNIGGHSHRVAELARALALRVGMSEGESQEVVLGALLHDIGKMGLPDNILAKPFNLLSVEERALFMKHPVSGQMMLLEIEQMKNVARFIRSHHESFDGKGFPDRLSGLEIPLGVRVLSVANDFDALQAGTLVSRPLTPADALRYLVDNKGKRYDPSIVDAFIALQNEKGPGEPAILPLRSGHLKAGMTLAGDLLHQDGYLLLAKGFVLSDSVIEQLRKLESSDGRQLVIHVLGP
jgi:putative nucleotidyltransferase with HDIG domain